MQEHMAAAGAKDPAGAAAALAEEDIEAFEDLLAIDESDLLTALKNCGIKAGSAAAIKKYCVQFGGSGSGGAAAEEAFAASNIKEALDGVDKLEEMLDAADGNADVAGHVLSCAGAVLKLASGVPGVGSIAKPFLECISFLQKVERETKDVIEILRQFLSMLRFIAELPETLEQLAARERQKLERELEKLLRLVEEFKAAIMSLGGGEKKKGLFSRMSFTSSRNSKATLKADPNVLLEVHDYQPSNFTGGSPTVDSWGSTEDLVEVQEFFAFEKKLLVHRFQPIE